jgi:hypothetical protein
LAVAVCTYAGSAVTLTTLVAPSTLAYCQQISHRNRTNSSTRQLSNQIPRQIKHELCYRLARGRP